VRSAAGSRLLAVRTAPANHLQKELYVVRRDYLAEGRSQRHPPRVPGLRSGWRPSDQEEGQDRQEDHRAANVHTYVENEVMYPEVRALLPDLEEDILECYEEHHVADVLCMELYGMPADAERFDAKTAVLIETVTQHIKEEERDWFPKVRAGLDRKQLQKLGAQIEQAKEKAPRSPARPSAVKKTLDAVIS
jgi:hypothetical protein